ncbi:MAG: methyltransferase domain-containing protein [Candidatus Sericytochromatia bacterium]
MKLAFFPLFHPSNFEGNGFQGTGLDYLSAYYLTSLIPFLEKQFPQLQICLEITLPRIMVQRPDLVIIWSTTPSFGQVDRVAEVIKQNLEVPIILAGPHISHLPQSLPTHVDIGLLGEPEIPLNQLLPIFIKDPNAGPIKYGKVPGLIYQSRGRIYSGSPTKIVQNIDQLPLPRHNLFHNLPGRSVPVITTSRGPNSLISLLTQPPAAKVRLFSAERTLEELSQVARDYRQLYRNWPLPENLLSFIFPVYIADEAFLSHPERFQAICEGILSRGLDKMVFFMVSAFPDQLTRENCQWLQRINTRKIIMPFASFSKRDTPLFPGSNPQAIQMALDHCDTFQMGVLGSYLLNPLGESSRAEMARTYWYLWEKRNRFDKLQAIYLPPMPGTPLWEPYQLKHKLKGDDLEHQPWHQFDPERYSPTGPFLNRSLDNLSFQAIMQKCLALAADQGQIADEEKAPMKQEQARQAHVHSAKVVQKKYLQPDSDILDVLLEPGFAIAPHLPPDYCRVQNMEIQGGELIGKALRPVDMILMRGSLSCLKKPAEELKKLTQWLKPDGKMLISILNTQNIAFILRALNWELERSRYPYKLLKYYSEQTLRALLQTQGLEILDTEYTIMNNIQGFRDSAEGFMKRVQTFWPVPMTSERLYIIEICMLVKKKGT